MTNKKKIKWLFVNKATGKKSNKLDVGKEWFTYGDTVDVFRNGLLVASWNDGRCV